MNRREFVGCAAALAVPIAWRGVPWIDVVARYGVRNDGSEPAAGASNAQRIATAMGDASGTGGTVFFPAGTYRIGSGLTVPADGITVAGEGRATRFDPRFGNASVDFVWSCMNRHDVTFRDFTVGGTHSGGIRIHASTGCRVLSVDVSGATRVNAQGFCAGLYVSAVDDLTVDSCSLSGNGRGRAPGVEGDADICANMGSEQIRFSRVTNNRCLSTAVHSNIVLFDALEVTVSGNTAAGAIVSQKAPDKQGYGILLYHTATMKGVKRGLCHVTDNLVRDTEGTGIFIQGMPDTQVTNNTVFRAGSVQADGALAVGGIVVEGIEDPDDLYGAGTHGRVGRQTVDGNRVSDCARAGISLSSTTATVCAHNVIDRCRYGISVRGDSADLLIENNLITNVRASGEGMGIGQWSDGTIPRVRIAGNVIRGIPAAAVGIWARRGSRGWRISDNDVSAVRSGTSFVVQGDEQVFSGNRADGRVLAGPP